VSEQPLEPRAGEIWLVNCDPQVGREQGGVRPALVVSNDYYNDLPNDLFVIVPITTRNRGLRLQIPIESPEGGLRQSSIIMCDQVKSASRQRFIDRWEAVRPETLERVRQILDLFLKSERSI
jgi:mRNA interferase MazF